MAGLPLPGITCKGLNDGGYLGVEIICADIMRCARVLRRSTTPAPLTCLWGQPARICLRIEDPMREWYVTMAKKSTNSDCVELARNVISCPRKDEVVRTCHNFVLVFHVVSRPDNLMSNGNG